jgi:hypothetical protein
MSTAGCPLNSYNRADAGCQCQTGLDKVCTVKGLEGGMVPGCIDSMTNASNCGACGTVCEPNAACIAGHCGKSPTALVAAATGCTSIHLVYETGKIYWTDQGHGTVKSVATTGGAPTSLSMGEMAPTFLVVKGGALYWINSGNNTIRALPAGGGAATTIVAMAPPSPDGGLGPTTEGIHGIALSDDGMTVYFTAGTDFYKVPKAGGAAVNVGYSEGPRHGIPKAIAVNTQYAFYPTDLTGNVEMAPITAMCSAALAAPPEPLCPLRLARSQGGLLNDAIFVRGDNVYWANDDRVKVKSIAAALDAGLAAASTDFAGAVNFGNVTGFALGTANAYFGEFPTGGTNAADGFVEKSPNPPYAAGMTPTATAIARNQPAPASLAVDGTNVYWTTNNCDIQMLADMPQ